MRVLLVHRPRAVTRCEWLVLITSFEGKSHGKLVYLGDGEKGSLVRIAINTWQSTIEMLAIDWQSI